MSRKRKNLKGGGITTTIHAIANIPLKSLFVFGSPLDASMNPNTDFTISNQALMPLASILAALPLPLTKDPLNEKNPRILQAPHHH
jgi:hypothetical protein